MSTGGGGRRASSLADDLLDALFQDGDVEGNPPRSLADELLDDIFAEDGASTTTSFRSW